MAGFGCSPRRFEISLPRETSVLLLCDPIWYAGRKLSQAIVDAVSCWQQRTGSLVIIDGSFQYLSWEEKIAEYSSVLDSEHTFRLVCPTKALAIHSYRFSYLIHPSRFHEELTFLYESLVGSVGVGNLAFGRRALEVLSSERSNRPLTEFFRKTFRELVAMGFLHTEIRPNCGYYVFGVPHADLRNRIAMDQNFFELTGYPNHVRINLMVARQLYLDSSKTLPADQA